MWPEWAADADDILAMAAGRLPDGVNPKSALGQRYQHIIDAVERDIAAAPPLTDAQVATIVPILRQGGWGGG